MAQAPPAYNEKDTNPGYPQSMLSCIILIMYIS